MRYLLTALLLVPALVSAQELHSFKNGEVADATKVNENFDALMKQITTGGHPEGDIYLRPSDSVVRTQVIQLGGTKKEVELQSAGETWTTVTESQLSAKHIQQGIPFNLQWLARTYSFSGDPNPMCTEGTILHAPIEIYQVYYNDLGGFIYGTDWDFSPHESPHPDVMNNNASGSYVCIGSSNTMTLNMKIHGSVGRYECASTTENRGTLPLDDPAVTNVTYRIPTLAGQPDMDVGVSYTNTAVGGTSSTSALNLDIPASCSDEQRSDSESSNERLWSELLGIEIDLP